MENIKRNIKLFWVSHSGPIKLAVLIIAGIILVLRGLDQLAVEEQAKKEKIRNQQILQEVKVNGQDIKVVEEFLNLCEKGYTIDAYNLLSQKCKNDKFPSLEEFQDNYFNKIFLEVDKNGDYYKTFNKKLDIKVEYDSLKDLYKVTFNESLLETGNIDNKSGIINYYSIDKEDSNKKIYIETE